MSPDFSDLLKRALALPVDERAALANTLLDSLETPNQSVEEARKRSGRRRNAGLSARTTPENSSFADFLTRSFI
jgi:hypothetical protein